MKSKLNVERNNENAGNYTTKIKEYGESINEETRNKNK